MKECQNKMLETIQLIQESCKSDDRESCAGCPFNESCNVIISMAVAFALDWATKNIKCALFPD